VKVGGRRGGESGVEVRGVGVGFRKLGWKVKGEALREDLKKGREEVSIGTWVRDKEQGGGKYVC